LSDAEERRLFKALQEADRLHTIPVFIALETGAQADRFYRFEFWSFVWHSISNSKGL